MGGGTRVSRGFGGRSLLPPPPAVSDFLAVAGRGGAFPCFGGRQPVLVEGLSWIMKVCARLVPRGTTTRQQDMGHFCQRREGGFQRGLFAERHRRHNNTAVGRFQRKIRVYVRHFGFQRRARVRVWHFWLDPQLADVGLVAVSRGAGVVVRAALLSFFPLCSRRLARTDGSGRFPLLSNYVSPASGLNQTGERK